MKKRIFIATLTLALIITGCTGTAAVNETPTVQPEEETITSEEPAEAEQPPAEAPAEETAGGETEETQEDDMTENNNSYEALSAASLHFNHELMGTLQGDKNAFFSPYSILSALAMTDSGAVGATKEELEKALGIADLEAFEQDIKNYLEKPKDEKAYINTANGIWIDQSLKLSDDFDAVFKKDVEDNFKAQISTVDFKNNSQKVGKEISDWVAEATEGFISNYNVVCDEDTVMDLINAVYFYGEWYSPFAAIDTYDDTFHGKTRDTTVSMMSKEETDKQYVGDYKGISALTLPYENREIQMDIFISADKSRSKDILEIFNSLSEEEQKGLFEELDNAEPVEINSLKLPKFTLDETFPDMEEALKAAGINRAFSNNNEFSGIAENIYISKVNHRARIEVDEEGSRAAAVTEVDMVLGSAFIPEKEIINFIVDGPFVFVIRDRSAGNVLFTGYVTDL